MARRERDSEFKGFALARLRLHSANQGIQFSVEQGQRLAVEAYLNVADGGISPLSLCNTVPGSKGGGD